MVHTPFSSSGHRSNRQSWSAGEHDATDLTSLSAPSYRGTRGEPSNSLVLRPRGDEHNRDRGSERRHPTHSGYGEVNDGYNTHARSSYGQKPPNNRTKSEPKIHVQRRQADDGKGKGQMVYTRSRRSNTDTDSDARSHHPGHRHSRFMYDGDESAYTQEPIEYGYLPPYSQVQTQSRSQGSTYGAERHESRHYRESPTSGHSESRSGSGSGSRSRRRHGRERSRREETTKTRERSLTPSPTLVRRKHRHSFVQLPDDGQPIQPSFQLQQGRSEGESRAPALPPRPIRALETRTLHHPPDLATLQLPGPIRVPGLHLG
jgi:hypothetical protein